MGNQMFNFTSSPLINGYNPSQWKFKEHLIHCSILFNTKLDLNADCYQLPAQQIQKNITIYENRRPGTPQSRDIVWVYHIIIEENDFMCGKQKIIHVLTEHIPLRLSKINGLQQSQALGVLKGALSGFHCLSQQYQNWQLNQNCIGFNQTGKVKVWINENFGSNGTQTIYNQRNNQNNSQNNLNKDQRNRYHVKLIMDAILKHTHAINKTLINFFQQYKPDYQQAIKKIDHYSEKYHIRIAPVIRTKHFTQDRYFQQNQNKSLKDNLNNQNKQIIQYHNKNLIQSQTNIMNSQLRRLKSSDSLLKAQKNYVNHQQNIDKLKKQYQSSYSYQKNQNLIQSSHKISYQQKPTYYREIDYQKQNYQMIRNQRPPIYRNQQFNKHINQRSDQKFPLAQNYHNSNNYANNTLHDNYHKINYDESKKLISSTKNNNMTQYGIQDEIYKNPSIKKQYNYEKNAFPTKNQQINIISLSILKKNAKYTSQDLKRQFKQIQKDEQLRDTLINALDTPVKQDKQNCQKNNQLNKLINKTVQIHSPSKDNQPTFKYQNTNKTSPLKNPIKNQSPLKYQSLLKSVPFQKTPQRIDSFSTDKDIQRYIRKKYKNILENDNTKISPNVNQEKSKKNQLKPSPPSQKVIQMPDPQLGRHNLMTFMPIDRSKQQNLNIQEIDKKLQNQFSSINKSKEIFKQKTQEVDDVLDIDNLEKKLSKFTSSQANNLQTKENKQTQQIVKDIPIYQNKSSYPSSFQRYQGEKRYDKIFSNIDQKYEKYINKKNQQRKVIKKSIEKNEKAQNIFDKYRQRRLKRYQKQN